MSESQPSYERPQDPVPGQYQAPYPPPGYYPYYPPPPPPGMPRPSNYLGWAIGAIFLFWPLAIPAIIKSTQVDRLWAEGRYDLARDASNTTKTLCLIATIIAAVLFVFFILMWFVLFNTVARYAPPFPR
ncbi:CD225/dispanin family protein [Actinocrispum wychmicini]|uniref:Interferon-induced transmembrane protein n=1 Tax=Actinocrispum wychmicini TaxID=1213861 RepID=A0A4R2IZP1_9PSEU|nr:CD225/dispanin family protein [Actinocrispum wychmicini]TCO50857.1 interferon-induced transmembrane protein [Actinocrispum wychmicini]